MVENGRLDFRRHPVGMWPSGTRHTVEQAFRTIGLEVAPDLVELLAGIARDLAGSGYIGKFRSKVEQRKLAPCYLVHRGHVGSPLRLGLKFANSILNPFRSSMATPRNLQAGVA